uniref:Graves disease carrier protein-like n=1 Tax=Phallusia mammillata TaxID=59560 RepID=A0A6F9DT30_9ASCI|nr:graves disease carrier protein-like [Phallusia mammillata]
MGEDIKKLLAGGVSGCCAKTCIAPLDRTKILLQAKNPYYKDFGVFSCMREICRREGIVSLWKGNTMMMIRIFPYSAIQFYSFEKYLGFFNKVFGNNQLNKGLAGSCAGVSSVLATYPLDMVRARLAFQITGEHRYNGIYSAFSQIFRHEGGIVAFYRGISPTVAGMIPYAGSSWLVYKTLEEITSSMMPTKTDENNVQLLVIKMTTSFLSGGVAGAISQTASYPLDVARRRMQLANVLPNSHHYKGMWSTLSAVYRHDGIVKGLYRGLSINYIRVIPQQAIAYTTFKAMKEILDLN